MRICITHVAGVGQHAVGAVVEMDDHRATRLIHDGYAVPAKPEKAKKQER